MKAKKGLSVLLILILCIPFNTLKAQSLEETLRQLLGENAKGYVKPIVNALGVGINSGLYRKASTQTATIPLPLGFDLGIIMNVIPIPDSYMTFEYSLMENSVTFPLSTIEALIALPEDKRPDDVTLYFNEIYDNGGITETPTIASDEEGVHLTTRSEDEVYMALRTHLIEDQGMSATDVDTYLQPHIMNFLDQNLDVLAPNFPFPDGLNLSIVPTANIQANVRIPFGIELQARYIPKIKINDDLGNFTMYGAGLRKDLPVPIVDVSVGAFYQIAKVGTIIEATNINYHAEIGKSLPIISPYVGIGYDQSTIDVNYTIPAGIIPGINEEQKIALSMDGDNHLRFTGGFTLKVIPFTFINAEVAWVEDYFIATAGLGFIFK
ncbi:MAG: hypothetical protein PHE86_00975 [Candidatus Marinimicrobia bacterium]|nr:hypothetical protein [Candidatus Neomarinimicrobiota bacterium]MDD5581679.1 hypothetical protein [Candidatus Neomarinimicrobiota bacterium]